MRNFRELEIWKRSFTMVNEIYKITSQFPDSEKYGLVSQIRRSAVSVPSNIAEGCSRNSNKDFNRFLEIALGSSFELETQLLLSKTQGYGNEKLDDIIIELSQIQKMTNAYRTKLKTQS